LPMGYRQAGHGASPPPWPRIPDQSPARDAAAVCVEQRGPACRRFPARPTGPRHYGCVVPITAQTVKPASSSRMPQLRARCATMPSPRPPRDDSEGWPAWGRVGPPPSLTVTSTDPAASTQVTCSCEPGNGRACRIALLSSSLTTSAASPMTGSKRPASTRSSIKRRRATATLAGTQGRSTTLDFLTSSASAPMPQRTMDTQPLRAEMPRRMAPETGTGHLSTSSPPGRSPFVSGRPVWLPLRGPRANRPSPQGSAGLRARAEIKPVR
jgi:hypothetical protein